MRLETLYFEEGGPQNTAATLDIALERALALGIRQVVVASSHGGTALQAAERFIPKGITVTAVSIGHGYASLGWCMTPAERARVEAAGVRIVTGLSALGDGIGSALSEKYGGRAPEEIVRDTLYTFSQGMKVAVESILMAAEAGLVDMEHEVIGIAGSSNGADTAIVCWPSFARTFLSFQVREVLAKPRIP
ncbi:MAG: hypothetical protein ABFD20_08665 [Anaerolineales bacterium]